MKKLNLLLVIIVGFTSLNLYADTCNWVFNQLTGQMEYVCEVGPDPQPSCRPVLNPVTGQVEVICT